MCARCELVTFWLRFCKELDYVGSTCSDSHIEPKRGPQVALFSEVPSDRQLLRLKD
jgi:hypothetical protein